MADFEVYEHYMFKLKHGHPLWQPEPSQREVLIGDVGFIKEGTFYPLFNMFKDGNDPVNRGSVPPDFESLPPRRLFNNRKAAIKKGSLFSRTIQMVDVNLGTSTNVGADGTLKFQCKYDRGAILVLNHQADQQTVYWDRSIADHIKKHFQDWTMFARSPESFGLQDEDNIIFVSGFMKTASSWSMAAITRGGKSATIEFDASGVATAGATVKREKQMNVQQRKWPPDPTYGEASPKLTYDHTIFLRYYKAKQSRFRGMVLKAAAGPHHLPSPDRRGSEDNRILTSDSEDGSDLEEVPSFSKTFDPLDYVLDYILEESGAEFAIASISGFYAACPDEVPDDIEKFLREKKPPIYKTDDSTIGILLCEPDMLEALMGENERPVATFDEYNVTETGRDTDLEQHSSSSEESSPSQPPQELPEDDPEGGTDKKQLIPEGEEFGSQVTLYSIFAFSANDVYLVGGGTDGSIMVWELGTGRLVIKCLSQGQASTFTAFQSRSQQFQTVGPPLGTINTIEFSPVMDSTFVCGTDTGKAVWWNVDEKQWKLIGEGVHTSAVRNVKWTPDGTIIATMTMDSKIRLWDSTSLKLLRTIDGGNNGSPHPLAFSPDGSHVLSANSQFCVQVWAVQTGQEVGCLKGHEGVIWSFAYSPDGKRLVTGSDDGTAQIWSAETYESLIILAEMIGPVWHVTFTKDGERVCVGQTDGAMVVFDSFDGSKLCAIEGESVDDASTACQPRADLSPDGTKVIVTSGPRVVLCDGKTGQSLGRVEQMDNISVTRFSHDGNRVATAAEDGETKVWNLDMFFNEAGSGVLTLDA